MHFRICRKRSVDFWPHLIPIQATISAPKSRDGNRPDAKLANLFHWIVKPTLHIFHAAARSPVSFRWKIDDPSWSPGAATEIEDLHPPQHHFASVTRFLIGAVHLWQSLSKLQGNSFSHDSHRIHGVHQSFCRCLEEVALCNFN